MTIGRSAVRKIDCPRSRMDGLVGTVIEKCGDKGEVGTDVGADVSAR